MFSRGRDGSCGGLTGDNNYSLENFRDAVTLVLREQVQQRTAEQRVELPQSPEETVDAVTLVPRERVQQ